MLSVRMLDDIYANISGIEDVEQDIINEALAYIFNLNSITDITMSAARLSGSAYKKLRKMVIRALPQIQDIVNEALARTITNDEKVYKSAGLPILPYIGTAAYISIVNSTVGTLYDRVIEVASKTVATMSMQYTGYAYNYISDVVKGNLTPEEAIKKAVAEYSKNGIASVRRTDGRYEYLDSVLRREIMTGITQMAGNSQLEYAIMMGADYVETTAHHGARPTHEVWQGKVFKLLGSDEYYENFYIATQYGEGVGLCGWNCRHSFFPTFPEYGDTPARSADELRALNNKTVTYNGKKMDMYEASKKQGYLERGVRRWDREARGLKSLGLDDTLARKHEAEWRGRLRDFTTQTGLTRRYFREKGA